MSKNKLIMSEKNNFPKQNASARNKIIMSKNKRVGVNCSKFDCSTLLAGNQLLDVEQLILFSSATYKLKKSIFYL